MRSDFSLIFWIVLLVLLLSGTITLGGIFSFIFYIIGFFILLSLIGTLIFRYRMRKIQQQMNEQGAQYRTYTWHFGGGRQSAEKTNSSQANRNEGRVRVETSVKPQKRVNDDVGEYVDFEEK